MKVRGDFSGPPRSTDKTTLIIKVSKDAKIRNRYNQVPHLTRDTNGIVTNSQLYTTNESQEVSSFLAGYQKHNKSLGTFPDAQGQVTHKSLVGSCQKSNPSEIL